LDWVLRRVDGAVDGEETPLGIMPAAGELNLDGLDLTERELEGLFAIDADAWLAESDLTEEYFARFGAHLPDAMSDQLELLRSRLRS
ncbi:MAG: phosphoenolpyruvate carboxykinase (GTP), partial [Actinomycetales bacterium]|nr:phosphoenolpyruvate carboxykinase (GTP) [Actinomycetales bacterium]